MSLSLSPPLISSFPGKVHCLLDVMNFNSTLLCSQDPLEHAAFMQCPEGEEEIFVFCHHLILSYISFSFLRTFSFFCLPLFPHYFKDCPFCWDHHPWHMCTQVLFRKWKCLCLAEILVEQYSAGTKRNRALPHTGSIGTKDWSFSNLFPFMENFHMTRRISLVSDILDCFWLYRNTRDHCFLLYPRDIVIPDFSAIYLLFTANDSFLCTAFESSPQTFYFFLLTFWFFSIVFFCAFSKESNKAQTHRAVVLAFTLITPGTKCQICLEASVL